MPWDYGVLISCLLPYFSPFQEYQSFTDLLFSKDKTLTCIEWHPTIKGVIAVSCAERVTFDDRVDNASKILMNPSLILLWSFLDPIHPQVCNVDCLP